MILNKIIEEKRKEVEELKRDITLNTLIEKAERLKSARRHNYFKSSISRPHKMHLIAEVKKASPSAGVIVEDFDPLKIAGLYEASGASAISVVTDKKFFMGSLSYLESIKKVVEIPVLRKDFIIDDIQLYQSVLAGSDAVLLIADLLSASVLKRFVEICERFSMDALVEVHSEEDLDKTLDSGCGIIGINNRNLHNFKVDISNTTRLLKSIPAEKIKVSESGIYDREDVLYLHSLGINAVLIGEALVRSANIEEKIQELMG